MFDKDLRGLLTGVVEVDETYIGGKPGKRGRGTKKSSCCGNDATWRGFKNEKLITIICLL